MSTSTAEQLIERNIDLPTLPQVVAKINALVDDPEVGVREIGAAVAQDAPTAARVLRLANSAYFGLRERVLTAEHASAVLGVRMLRTVALQVSVIHDFAHLAASPDFDLVALWKHSILTGQIVTKLAGRCGAKTGLATDEFHVIGLLHDIGKVLMLEGMREAFLATQREARLTGEPAWVCEERNLGFHHAHVGAMVATHWHLPAPIAGAVQLHHAPLEQLGGDPVAMLIRVANRMAHGVADGELQQACDALDDLSAGQLGLARSAVGDVVQQAAAVWPTIEL